MPPQSEPQTNPYRKINTIPHIWKGGDTVQISFIPFFDSTKWIEGSIGLEIPGSETELIEYVDDFILQWIPTDTFLARKPSYALMTSGFINRAAADTEFVALVKVLIVERNGGFFSFQLDSSYTKVDTIPQVLPADFFLNQ